MEKIKEFFSNTKKTATLALIMNVIGIIAVFMAYRSFGIIIRLMSCLFNIGILIYFIIIVLRLNKKSGNIKVANYILVIYFALSSLSSVISIALSKNTVGVSSYMQSSYIIQALVYIILTLYFCKILLKAKIPVIDNIIFVAIMLIYVSNILITEFNIYTIIFALSYLSIIPYFYNYYELLERSNQNGK